MPEVELRNHRAQAGNVGPRRVLVGGDIKHRHDNPALGRDSIVGVPALERRGAEIITERICARRVASSVGKTARRRQIAERLAEVGPAEPVDETR